jgi:hypothetical protein
MTRDAAKRLLRLYPARWRERYGEEFGAVLEGYDLSPSLLWDTCRGAMDAYLIFGQAERRARNWRRSRRRRAAVVALVCVCLCPVALPMAGGPPRAILL